MKARNNPFRTDRVLAVRYRLCDETLNDLLERLQKMGFRGAIIGPNGTGKTTLLEDLEPALCALGFRIKKLRLDDEKRSFAKVFIKDFFADLTAQDFILFDGAEQMTTIDWQLFKFKSKKAGGMLITAYRKGLLPTLKECETSPELLQEIISDLLGGASSESSSSTTELFHRHRGNIRVALREMYDVYAGKPI